MAKKSKKLKVVKNEEKGSLLKEMFQDFGFDVVSVVYNNVNDQSWIWFRNMETTQKLMQVLLADHRFNAQKENFNTLYQYLTDNGNWTVVFGDETILSPYEDLEISTGIVEHSIMLRFPKEHFEDIEVMFYNIFVPQEL